METQANLNACVIDYLNGHNVLCLATCDSDRSWVAPVFYAVWQNALVFLSAPHTRHCQNLQSNPRASGSIQEDCNNWQMIKGIQLEGVVYSVEPVDENSVIACYSKKFPVTGPNAPAPITKALDKVSWFEFHIEKLFYIDNARGFGNRDEIDLAQLF